MRIPHWSFKIWLDQLLLAVTVKEDVNPAELLEDPEPVLEEPVPRRETRRETKYAQAVIDRDARDKLEQDRVLLENEERRVRGPKIGHNVYYHEVQKILASRLFLALGTERKKCLYKKTHIQKSQNWNLFELAKISFEKKQSVTSERYKLFNRSQEAGERLEAFHAALIAQAARAELGTLRNELVRDLIISKMKNTVLQDTLTFETFTPDKVL